MASQISIKSFIMPTPFLGYTQECINRLKLIHSDLREIIALCVRLVKLGKVLVKGLAFLIVQICDRYGNIETR